MKYKKLVFLLAALLSSYSYAYDDKGGTTTVEYIYVPANGGNPYVQFGVNGMPGCHNNDGGYLPGGDKADKTYALILSAFHTKANVKVYYNFANTDADYTGWGRCHIESVGMF